MPTIYEIAQRAGVSAATVSKALNNYPRVNEKTREKVLEVALEMGYVPNVMAQSLRTKQSFLVGVIFSENVGIGLDHQFFSKVLEAFRHRIGSHGYDTIFITNSHDGKEISYLENCKYRKVDGAFIITTLEDDINMVKLIESKIKCVTTDMIIGSVPFVISDNEEGGRMAVHYLYERGHRKIGHIAGPLHTISAGERFKGYETGLAEVGLTFEENLMIQSERYDANIAYDITSEYLERFEAGDWPTALFVSSDLMALAVMKALKSKGIRVPEDISVIGYDDIEVASLVSPALTTIRQDTLAIGNMVADTLYRLITGESVASELPRIPVALVERETVRRLPITKSSV